jgi:hypothetical protein
VFAEEDNKDFAGNRVFNYGLGSTTKNYKFLSALDYSGPSINTNLSFFQKRFNGISTFNVYTNFGLLSHDNSNSYMYNLDARINYSYNHKLLSLFGDELKIYAGALLNVSFDFNYLPINTNNPVAFIMANNLCASSILKYDFNISTTKISITNEMYMSMIGFTLFAPEYAFPTPYYYYEKEHDDFSQSVQSLNVSNYLNFNNKLYFDIKSQYLLDYTIRLTYEYSGLNATINQNDYNYSNHAFMFGIVYKIFKY